MGTAWEFTYSFYPLVLIQAYDLAKTLPNQTGHLGTQFLELLVARALCPLLHFMEQCNSWCFARAHQLVNIPRASLVLLSLDFFLSPLPWERPVILVIEDIFFCIQVVCVAAGGGPCLSSWEQPILTGHVSRNLHLIPRAGFQCVNSWCCAESRTCRARLLWVLRSFSPYSTSSQGQSC